MAPLGGCTTAPSTQPSEPASTQPPASIRWEKYSDDIFARAKKENRLILLDLEAVWCHWCHVQDENTYTDPKVIGLINERYIAVKVDQDSRPDLSNRYEDFGWPATIVLSAAGQDIVRRSGYIPPAPMAAMLAAIIADPTPGPSAKAAGKMEFRTDSSMSPELGKELEAKLLNGYDPKSGGWGTVHKVVDWDAVEYCMMRGRAGDADADRRARQTLDGGLNLIDPVWGGVYQYSAEGDWAHPHFEKLMQFQAEQMRIYALAGERYHEAKYLKAAADIRGYVARFLTSPWGTFYVSQDADLIDGQHSAGYFALGDAERLKLGIPRVDTHCYARENGWAIRGLLAYYAVTQDPADLHAATKAAAWVIEHRGNEGGGFRHDESDAAGPYLGDTLAMGRAFVALYEATADRAWLKRAEAAADFIEARFRAASDNSSSAAGYVTASSGNPPSAGEGPGLPPSATMNRGRESVLGMGGSAESHPTIDDNVAAARFFNLLFHYSGQKKYKTSGGEAMRFLATPGVSRSRKLWVAGLLLADAELATEPLHVTIVGAKSDPAASALFMVALQAPTGYRRIEWYDSAEGPLPHADVEYPQLGEAAAFLCTGNACSSPISEPGKLARKLGGS